MKNFRFTLLLILGLGIFFGNYSCKKDKTSKQSSNNGDDDNDDDNNNGDDNCNPPLETYSITFTGQDVEPYVSNFYRYKFMIDTLMVTNVVNYLMDWDCNTEKKMYLYLNETRKDSLTTLSWNWDPTPGSVSFSAANRAEGPDNEHTIGVSLVETGVGESYIYFVDTVYTDLGIENYYDPNGEYKLTFVYFKE